MAQFTNNGVVYEELPDGNVRVVGYAQQQQGDSAFGGPAPGFNNKQALSDADLQRAQAQAAAAAAQAPTAGALAAADLEAKRLANRKAQRDLTQGAGENRQSAQTRSAAIAGYNSGSQLLKLVDDIEAKYRAGPGSTKGIAGLSDYLPTTANQRFDAAGNAARGIVGQALGFTGGQLNTAREAEMAVGPYLPQASDRDEVIQDKITRLRDLANLAHTRSVSQLGGVPDQNGNIVPVNHPQAAAVHAANIANPPPSGGNGGGASPDGSGGAPPTVSLATGSSRTEENPVASKLIDTMIRRGASPDDINAALGAIGGGSVSAADVAAAQAYHRKNPGYKGSFGYGEKQVDNGFLNRAASSPLGAGVIGAADAASLGTLDNLTSDPAATRAKMQALSAAHPYASLAGNVVGGAAAAGGLELGLGGLATRTGVDAIGSPIAADALYGSGYGAGASDDDRLTGAVTGGLGGVAGGMFGRGLVGGAGRALRGVQNADANLLRQRGVPLTAGQAAGGIIKGIEDRLSGLPVIGDVIRNRRLEGYRAFNNAAFDEGLAPIGASTNGVIGNEGIDAARAARSQAYSNALDPVRVSADQPFVQDMQGAIQAGQALPDPMRGNAAYTLPTRVGNSFDANGGLTGRDFQQSIRGLRRDAKAVANQPYGYDFGQVTGQAENALEGLLGRQSPGTLPAYQAANAANRNVEVLRDAVNRGRNGTRVGEPGVFAPSQLVDAAASNAGKFGNAKGTTNQPFYDLARAGQNVLPNSIPDSGTAGRLLTQGALGLAGAGALGGTGYAAGGTEGAEGLGAGGLTIGALLAAGGSRAGQRAITRALLDRPDAIAQLGDQVLRRRALGGMFGAGLGATGISTLSGY